MILSFKNIFVPAVVAGTKPHTIRAGQRWRVGMGIQFYQDARQKTMAKFRPDAVVTAVQRFEVIHYAHGCEVVVDNQMLTPLEAQELARRDGFDDLDGLFRFIAQLHGLPFAGQLIHWTDLRY